MWRAEALNLAREVKHLVHLPYLLDINTLWRSKTYHFWPLNIAKRNFWHAIRFELCTPDLKSHKVLVIHNNLNEICSPITLRMNVARKSWKVVCLYFYFVSLCCCCWCCFEIVVVAVVSRTFTVKVHPTWKNKHFKLANNWKKIEKRRKLRALHKI